MNQKKTRFLVLCNANVNRSKLAVPIFETKLTRLGLEGHCEFESAGIKNSRAPEHDYVNASLRRANYPIITDDRPRRVTAAMTAWADVIFTMNLEIRDYVTSKFATVGNIGRKTHILPHYGLPEESRKDNIFDPKDFMVSPHDRFGKDYPYMKRAASLSLLLLPASFACWAVDQFTNYVPTANSGYSERTVALYTRAIRELEPCIDGALARMQQEGLLPKVK